MESSPEDIRKSDPYAPFPKKVTQMGVELMDTLPEFIAALYAKLEKGAREYGDASLLRPKSELAGELAEEALDLAGWGFLLWYRCRYLQRALRTLSPNTKDLRDGDENADTRRR